MNQKEAGKITGDPEAAAIAACPRLHISPDDRGRLMLAQTDMDRVVSILADIIEGKLPYTPHLRFAQDEAAKARGYVDRVLASPGIRFG